MIMIKSIKKGIASIIILGAAFTTHHAVATPDTAWDKAYADAFNEGMKYNPNINKSVDGVQVLRGKIASAKTKQVIVVIDVNLSRGMVLTESDYARAAHAHSCREFQEVLERDWHVVTRYTENVSNKRHTVRITKALCSNLA